MLHRHTQNYASVNIFVRGGCPKMMNFVPTTRRKRTTRLQFLTCRLTVLKKNPILLQGMHEKKNPAKMPFWGLKPPSSPLANIKMTAVIPFLASFSLRIPSPLLSNFTSMHLIEWWHSRKVDVLPNQQQRRTLNKLPAELRRRNFVAKHRPSMQVGAQTCKKRACNVYIFRPSFHFAYHRCWLGLF